MELLNCCICGYPAEIIDDHGIGDVRCSNPKCENHDPKRIIDGIGFATYHFSGKFNTSKKDAIRKWNSDQSLEYLYHNRRSTTWQLAVLLMKELQ